MIAAARLAARVIWARGQACTQADLLLARAARGPRTCALADGFEAVSLHHGLRALI